MNFLQNICSVFAKYNGNKKLLCACSGGVDSMVLSFCLKKFYDVSLVHLVIINHKLRKTATTEAQRSKKALLQMGFKNVKIINWDHDEITSGIEEKARFARHKLIFEYAILNKIDTIFFAHHFNDLEENFFLKIGMGGGLSSFVSMREQKIYRYYGIFFNIIRPLIYVNKAEILDFAKANNIFFVEDESNKNDLFKRNRLRKSLKQMEISKMQFLNTMERLKESFAIIKQQLENTFKEIIYFKKDFGYFVGTFEDVTNLSEQLLKLCLKQIIFYFTERCEVREREFANVILNIKKKKGCTVGGMEIFFNTNNIFFIKEASKINDCIVFNIWDLRFKILETKVIKLPKIPYKIIKTLPFVKKNVEKSYCLNYEIQSVDFIIM